MSKRLVRNATFGVIGSIATIAGNFVSGLFIARVLGVERTGLVAFAIWVSTTGVTLASTGLPFTLSRFLPELSASDQEEEAQRLGSYLLKPYLLISAIPALGMVGYAIWLWSVPTSPMPGAQSLSSPLIWVLAAACCATQSAADFARGYLRGLQRFDRVASYTIIGSICQPVVILVAGYALGVSGALLGYVVGNLIPAALLLSVGRGRGPIAPELKKRVLRYAAYRWAAEIMAAFAWARLEVVFLEMYTGTASVGLFTVGLTIANMAIQGPLMLTWGLIPHFSERVGRKEFERLGDEFATGTRMMSFMVLPSCIGLAAIMPCFLPLLYGTEYDGAIASTTVLVCGAGLAATAQVSWNILWAMERTDVELYFGAAGALVAVAGGVFLVPAFGPLGAAYSRAFTQVAVGTLASWFVIKRLHFALPIGYMVRLLLASLACGGVAKLVILYVAGLQGLLLAIAAAAITYVVAVRCLSALPPGDVDKFRSVAHRLPRPLSRRAEWILGLLAKDSAK